MTTEGQPNTNPTQANSAPASSPPPADLMKQIEELNRKIEALTAKPAPMPPEDLDLEAKAKAQREADERKKSETKALERALAFGMRSQEFLKTNESLLPKGIADIFSQAERENYANAIEKDAAIKSGMIQSFFAVQANIDLLTPGLKTALDEYLALTKNEKLMRAQSIYESIFEPAFDTLKRVKKAEALAKGYSNGGDAESAYLNKMIASAKKHHLGEK